MPSQLRPWSLTACVLVLVACSTEPPKHSGAAKVPPTAVGPGPSPVRHVAPSANATAAVAAEGPTQGDAIATLPVRNAIVAADRLVVLDTRATTVSAHAMHDGSRLWQRPFQSKAVGRRPLQRLGKERVLVRSGDKLTAIDVASGSLVAQHSLQMGDPTHLWERAGACGLRGECSMQLIDCDTAKPLGAPVFGKHISWNDFDGGHSSSSTCVLELHLVGRSGNVVVYLAAGVRGVGKVTAFGIDAVDGSVVWREPGIGCGITCNDKQLGMSPDARHCRAGSSSEDLQAFGCADGRRRWSRKFPDLELAIWAGDARGGIFVAEKRRALLLDPLTGHERWRTPIAAGALVLPSQARLPPHSDVWFQIDAPRQLVLLDVASGKAQSSTMLAPPGFVGSEAGGRVRFRSWPADTDHTGQELPLRPPLVAVERGRAPGSGTGPPNRAVVTAMSDGSVVAKLPWDAWTLGDSRRGVVGYVAIMVASQPPQVRLYRVPLH